MSTTSKFQTLSAELLIVIAEELCRESSYLGIVEYARLLSVVFAF
jgi:hypothetical protein